MRYVLLALVVMLTACSPSAAFDPTEPPDLQEAPPLAETGLAGTSWVLVEIMWGPPIAGTRFTLDFTESTIGGITCDGYSASYTASVERTSYGDGSLSIGEIETTDLPCERDGEGDQEVSYYNILSMMQAYRITSDGLLILENPLMDPCCLIFAPAADTPDPANIVNGTSWVVTQINGEAPLPDTEITASFDAEQISGSAGCNQYSASYTLGSLSDIGGTGISAVGTTKMLCNEPEGMMDQEALFVQILESVTNISRYGDGELTMSSGDGKSYLVLRAPDNPPPPISDLVDTDWILNSLSGSIPLDDTQLSLSFSEGAATGFGGCNTFSSNYWEDADRVIEIEGILTHGQCADPAGVMDQEAAYFNILRRVTRYTLINDSTLELSGTAGTLTFRRAPEYDLNPALLIGTTWVLRMIDGAELDLAFPAPTIEFVEQRKISGTIDNIRLGGFGGCRDFEVSFNYTSAALHFNDPKMLSETCEDADALGFEDNFFAKLVSTIAYVQDGDTLDLIGLNGRVLSFERMQ